MHLALENNHVINARYQCHGCGATIAAGSMLTEMILDRPIAECLAITAEELTEALEGLPPDKRHCAGFAVNAMRNALQTEDDVNHG